MAGWAHGLGVRVAWACAWPVRARGLWGRVAYACAWPVRARGLWGRVAYAGAWHARVRGLCGRVAYAGAEKGARRVIRVSVGKRGAVCEGLAGQSARKATATTASLSKVTMPQSMSKRS